MNMTCETDDEIGCFPTIKCIQILILAFQLNHGRGYYAKIPKNKYCSIDRQE